MSLGPRPAKYSQPIPQDLQGVRGGQIDAWQQLLKPGGFQNLGNYFGGMSNPATPLQRQSTGQISQFLNQPAPEMQALQTAMPALQGILGGKPGQGVMDALQPMFQRNLSMADQQGGRFGSANAIMRSKALEDYNLLGAQATQQGQQTQLQASQMLGMLSGQAGQNPFQRLMGGYGVGQQDANQQDMETQRRLQLMGFLMGGAQQAGFNIPFVQTQAGSPGLGGILAGLAGGALGGGGLGGLLSGLFGGGGGAGAGAGATSSGGGLTPDGLAALFG